jgi:hypothetical protein
MSFLLKEIKRVLELGPMLRETAARGDLRVLRSLLGPAYRGLIQRNARGAPATVVRAAYGVDFTWSYTRDRPEMTRLYEAAKVSQWNATVDLDWTRAVDPDDTRAELLPDAWMPTSKLDLWRKLSYKERSRHKHAVLSWLLSQFLHGEQGALFAAAQVTEAVPWLDAKLFGSSQVVDEGRHVEVFHTYLTKKLEKLYVIDDNLYVVLDALMSDGRWDMKFLGMQIMVEGLALGAFGAIRHATHEPLLRELLGYVITDEARHVHYGVLSLASHYREALSERERREREDWAFEFALLLRNRFLVHEIHEEFYAHAMTRKAWDALVLDSDLMQAFRKTMFRRIIPNLKRIGLLSERIKPRYRELGLLEYEDGLAAPDLSARDLLEA